MNHIQETYNKRLLTLAEYLESKLKDHTTNTLRRAHLIDFGNNGSEQAHKVLYHYWVIKLLEQIFDEFSICSDGELYYDTAVDFNDHISGAMIHFGLNDMSSFCSLFCVDEENPFTGKYGTNKLHRLSTPQDIATNIRQYLNQIKKQTKP